MSHQATKQFIRSYSNSYKLSKSILQGNTNASTLNKKWAPPAELKKPLAQPIVSTDTKSRGYSGYTKTAAAAGAASGSSSSSNSAFASRYSKSMPKSIPKAKPGSEAPAKDEELSDNTSNEMSEAAKPAKPVSFAEPFDSKFQSTFNDLPSTSSAHENQIDWTTSFFGASQRPFSAQIQKVLSTPIQLDQVEIKPDGIIYLPEIKYRRILNSAFGAGGWSLIPRSETLITEGMVSREYALICLNQFVSIARGEQEYYGEQNIFNSMEGCKSNALVRCCKDLGIASELWDPNFIKQFKAQYAQEVFAVHVSTKKKKKLWKRKDRELDGPYKQV